MPLLTRRRFLQAMAAGSAVMFTGCAASAGEFQAQSRVAMAEDTVSGYENWYATTCGECGAGCGVLVRVIEGRAKKLEGNPDDPISQGKLCARGQAAVQRQYNPDRIRGPLERTGGRGSAAFGTVSWEGPAAAASAEASPAATASSSAGSSAFTSASAGAAAASAAPTAGAQGTPAAKPLGGLDMLMSRLRAALSSGRQGTVVLITRPLRGTQALVVQRFVQAAGVRWLTLETIGEAPLREAARRVFGQDGLPVWDVAGARCILNFGSDFLNTGLSPVYYGVQYGIFRQGHYAATSFRPQDRPRGRMIQVEPVMSYTGSNADDWLPVRPGMEGVLALSIAHEAASAGAPGAGIFGGASALSAYAPDSVASRVGVSAERITQTARDLIGLQPSLVMAGGQAGAYTNGTENLTAALALNVMLGNLGKPGGVSFSWTAGAPGLPSPVPPSKLSDWAGLADALNAGQVELVLVHDADPVFELPPALGIGDALRRAGFMVSFSSFVDETTALADLVFPAHLPMEEWGDDAPEANPGFPVVHSQQPVVQPFYDTRSFYDVLLVAAEELGGALRSALPWATFKDAVMQTARGLQGLNKGSVSSPDFDTFWLQLRQRGGWWDQSAPQPAGGPAPSLGALASAFPPARFDGSEQDFPYVLAAFPSNSLGQGRSANLPWMQALPDPVTTTVWHSWVAINPRLGSKLGLREGDVVRLESPRGAIELPVYINYAAPPDVLAVPLGQGHANYGRYARNRGVNPMALLAPLADAGSGALAYGATRVRLSKTGRSQQYAKFEGDVPAFQIPGREVIEITHTS